MKDACALGKNPGYCPICRPTPLMCVVGDSPACQSSSASWQDDFPQGALRHRYLLQLGMPRNSWILECLGP